jgi:hypothetical protein
MTCSDVSDATDQPLLKLTGVKLEWQIGGQHETTVLAVSGNDAGYGIVPPAAP